MFFLKRKCGHTDATAILAKAELDDDSEALRF
jgi:hypothetical protein